MLLRILYCLIDCRTAAETPSEVWPLCRAEELQRMAGTVAGLGYWLKVPI